MTKFVFLELSLYVILTRLFFGSYTASTKIVCDIIDSSNAELDEIDIRKSLSSQNTISIIEWPESFEDFLPSPDIRIDLSHFNLEPDSRKIRVRYLKM